jgi:hypothetical protein
MTSDDKWLNQAFMPGGYTYQPDQGVTSASQTGGVTAHTGEMPGADRHLDEAVKSQLLEIMPRDRTVEVEAPMNDPEAAAFAQEIFDFLTGEGFVMQKKLRFSMRVPPLVGQHFDLESDPAVAKLLIGRRS